MYYYVMFKPLWSWGDYSFKVRTKNKSCAENECVQLCQKGHRAFFTENAETAMSLGTEQARKILEYLKEVK